MKMKYVFFCLISASLLMVSCTKENSANKEDEFSLLGTWSYIESISDTQEVQYHITFKADSTAVFCALVLDKENPNAYNEWRLNGQTACYYDSIFYKYSFDGTNVNLTKTGYKIYSNLPWQDQISGVGDKSNLYPQLKYSRINQYWALSITAGDNELFFTSFHLMGVYAYDFDHNGYTETSRNTYGENTAAAAEERGENATVPIARDASGDILYDAKGRPVHLYWFYGDANYQFKGGDPIFEDVNHDGQINLLDNKIIGRMTKQGYDNFDLQYIIDKELSPF